MSHSDAGEEEPQQQEEHSSSTTSEDALIEKLENVVIHSDENRDTFSNGDGYTVSDGGIDRTGVLPLRPYAGDCPHYVRTGACKFGSGCRFNHPAKKTQQHQLIMQGGREAEFDNSGTVECKYYSTEGGCKYGNSCRFSHPGEDYSPNGVPQLNALGLPMRLGEKECEYYLRNGSCSYGSRCVYHHPDPNTMAGKGYPNSITEKFGRRDASISENRNGGSLRSSGASQPYRQPWSPHGPPSENRNGGSLRVSGASQPYRAPWSPHGPPSENRSPHQSMVKQPEWNGYQASSYSNQNRNTYSTPSYPHQSTNSYSTPSYSHQSRNAFSTSNANGAVREPDLHMEVDEYPERPGQLECDYYMKTGSCKFKYTCRFHHPKNRTPKPDESILSKNGLPLRPGRSICRHFERQGLCKFGSACMFDHPVTHGSSTYPDWRSSRAAVTSDVGGWDD